MSVNISIEQTSDDRVEVEFDADMTIDAAYADPTSYVIDPEGPGGYPVSVTGVTVVSARKLHLDVSIATGGQGYLMTVVGLVLIAAGGDIQGQSEGYIAAVSLPYPTRVLVISEAVIRVTFSRAMDSNADLLNPEKYRFTNGLVAISVTKTGADTVELSTSRHVEGVRYTLQVFP